MGVLNSTPATYSTGQVVTAAVLNTEVRDPLTALQAAWTSYTPATTNITVGNGSVTGRYNRVGKTIDFQCTFTFGSTSAVSASPTFSLPVTALTTGWAATDGSIFDTSVGALGYYPVAGVALSTTIVTCRIWPSTAGNPWNAIGSTTPITWATGDVLTIQGRYEAA